MIYTIFFRKLQKKFGVAIQTMGYPESQKVYTPHLDIEKVQRENDNYYHCENKNDSNSKNDSKNNYHCDSKNDIDNENDSKNVGENHFHFLYECGNGYGGCWYWYRCGVVLV